MRYNFKYKRRFFWRTIKNVKGHSLNTSTGHMEIFLDAGIRSIHKWSNCDLKLGSDFILFQKDSMEKQANTSINLDK